MSLYRRISRHWSVIGVLLVTSVLLLLIFSVYIERGRSIEQIIGTKVADINREQRIKKQHPNFPLSGSDQIPKTSLKTILLWNTWFDWDPAFFFGTGRQPFVNSACPVRDCYVSTDRYLMPPEEYDAILFFFPMMTDVPFTYSRRLAQKYVFVNEEPPTLDSRVNLGHLNNFFNMTITYRKDSDIQWPYGTIETHLPPRNTSSSSNEGSTVKNYAHGKTKLVAWFVSNCNSHSMREKYVENLKKYVEVAVYGKCGDQNCWAGDQEECYDMLERDFKFYLSFENSLCRDYVTEKFFQIIDRRIVPIVFGGAEYKSIAPEGSYIDATKIGARKLAELLQTIDRDDELYDNFFRWKDFYNVVKDRRIIAGRVFCQLCKRLHEDNRAVQIYYDFEKWWGVDSHCHNSGIFSVPFKKFTFHDVYTGPDVVQPVTNRYDL